MENNLSFECFHKIFVIAFNKGFDESEAQHKGTSEGCNLEVISRRSYTKFIKMEAISNPTLTTAKKQHNCDFCKSIIPSGSIYLRSVWKDETIYTWKSHINCDKIAHILKMHEDNDGVSTDVFEVSIRIEYRKIKEGESYLYKFSDQLDFVLKHYDLI